MLSSLHCPQEVFQFSQFKFGLIWIHVILRAQFKRGQNNNKPNKGRPIG